MDYKYERVLIGLKLLGFGNQLRKLNDEKSNARARKRETYAELIEKAGVPCTLELTFSTSSSFFSCIK